MIFQITNMIGLVSFSAVLILIFFYLMRPKPFKRVIPSLIFLESSNKKKNMASFFKRFVKDWIFLLQLFIIILHILDITVMTIYTSSFAIQGEFHLGGEMRVRDFLDGLVAEFVPVTNAKLFPLVPPKANIATNHPFVIINTNFNTMYHSEDTE